MLGVHKYMYLLTLNIVVEVGFPDHSKLGGASCREVISGLIESNRVDLRIVGEKCIDLSALAEIPDLDFGVLRGRCEEVALGMNSYAVNSSIVRVIVLN